MSWLRSLRLPRERPSRPFDGYKLAYPMLSVDSTRVGFSGVSLGRSQVYGPVAEGVCIQSPRHHPPVRYCDCGFYCFHSLGAAQSLACDPQYRSAVVLEVLASGRYVRYEEGLRYSRQRVRVMRVGRCECGRPAEVLIDAGTGQVGWRRLVGACALCAGWRPALTLAAFARLAGHGLRVAPDDEERTGARAAAMTPLAAYRDDGPADPDRIVPLLTAEVALLQGRLDELQERLERLSRPGGGEGDGPFPYDRG